MTLNAHDCHAKGRINAIDAIINCGFVTVSLLEENMNSGTIYAWLIQDLFPKLSDRAIIVMDNASFHMRADILEAIKQHHALLNFSHLQTS